jgi:hypothetical protein
MKASLVIIILGYRVVRRERDDREFRRLRVIQSAPGAV